MLWISWRNLLFPTLLLNFFHKRKKPPNRFATIWRLLFGATGRTWTGDLLITNQLLYQLSHSSRKNQQLIYYKLDFAFLQELFPILLTVGKYFCAARPPLLLPAFFCAIISAHPPVAKLDIAADSDSEGRGFESLRAGQKRNTLCLPDKGCFFSTKSVLTDGINPTSVGWNHFVMKSDFVGR